MRTRTLVGLLVAAVAALTPGAAGASAPPSTTSTTVARGLYNPHAWGVGSTLYVDSSITATGRPSLLRRVVPSSGQVEARRRLAAPVADLVTARGGDLWALTRPTDTAGPVDLVELAPRSLAVLHTLHLQSAGTAVELAAAGGLVWAVDGGRLYGVDPATATIVRTREASASAGRGALFSAVGSADYGRSLVDAVIDRTGLAAIQRRDPTTGSLVTQRSVEAVAVFAVAGTARAVWASVATGTLGYVQRYSLGSLSPVHEHAASGSNAISATVADNVLYVTDEGGGAGNNFCGSTFSGRRQAVLASTAPAAFLTAFTGRGGVPSYLIVPNTSGARHRLQLLPTPRPCR